MITAAIAIVTIFIAVRAKAVIGVDNSSSAVSDSSEKIESLISSFKV